MRADRYFPKEISLIKNVSIREFVKQVFEKVPINFWTFPASSSGKYHPQSSQGHEGLVRHTKQVFYVAHTIIDSQMFGLSDIEEDIILASCLLHDSWKFPNQYLYRYHGRLACEKIEEIFFHDDFIHQKEWYNEILSCILAHSGRWSKEFIPLFVKNESHKKFSITQKIVEISDLLSSKPFLNFEELRVPDFLPKE